MKNPHHYKELTKRLRLAKLDTTQNARLILAMLQFEKGDGKLLKSFASWPVVVPFELFAWLGIIVFESGYKLPKIARIVKGAGRTPYYD